MLIRYAAHWEIQSQHRSIYNPRVGHRRKITSLIRHSAKYTATWKPTGSLHELPRTGLSRRKAVMCLAKSRSIIGEQNVSIKTPNNNCYSGISVKNSKFDNHRPLNSRASYLEHGVRSKAPLLAAIADSPRSPPCAVVVPDRPPEITPSDSVKPAARLAQMTKPMHGVN